ncbi:hypothetical protein B0I33_101302 [Prauserella shujinwangii]|uniref:Uncharacterized protein n=1 Tax=Prauserella shujinwangii TaxID=1453103 RepID=A0A2T0M362_9PSEU|nr:hypothetical protein [Prauserella shujinwangii]PRX51149.1 hypothetical protein B0I33_101302 [Prauserella shujinwangii]
MTAEGDIPRDDGTSLAEEIRLLVEMVVERAAPWLDSVVAAGHGDQGDQGQQEHRDRAGAACGWCPLCAIVAVVRGERPEVAARLLEQAAQLVALLRAVLADRWEPQEGVHMPGFRPSSSPGADGGPAPAGRERVQRITVRRRDDWERRC